MKKALFIGLGIVILVLITLGFLLRSPQAPQTTEETPEPIMCTMEAKICPDGTSVGRTGPRCEFAPCPTTGTTSGDINRPPEGGAEFDMGIGDASQMSADGRACVAQGGSWNPHYEECVGVQEKQCVAIGGTYNSCASACRHQPDADVCTLQCVEVCQL